MFLHTDRKLLQSDLRLLRVLVLHILLTHSCRGQPQLIGPPQSIVAGVGDDIILPCHLKPEMDVTAEMLEWTTSHPDPRVVHVRHKGQDLVLLQNPSYRGRTSLFPSELKHGNISLKLSGVQLSDQGTYGCDILNKWSSVQLVVASDTASSPVISLLGVNRNRGGVILNCDSNSWYPGPEVSWLDSEGHVLSAGPPETVRGPDGLYTVSSRVTVEKRHSSNFTCRVQQKDINQTRETQIHVPDDFFELQSSSSAVTAGLAVSLSVCILIILLFVFSFWRQNRNKTKTGHGTDDKAQKFLDNGKEKKKSKEVENNQQSADRKCCEANEELKRSREELDTVLLDETERHLDQQLWDQRQREEEAEKLQELMTKNTELEEKLQEEKMKREKAEEELEILRKKLVLDWDKDSGWESTHSLCSWQTTLSGDRKCEASVNPQRDETNSPSLSSNTGPVVQVNPGDRNPSEKHVHHVRI